VKRAVTACSGSKLPGAGCGSSGGAEVRTDRGARAAPFSSPCMRKKALPEPANREVSGWRRWRLGSRNLEVARREEGARRPPLPGWTGPSAALAAPPHPARRPPGRGCGRRYSNSCPHRRRPCAQQTAPSPPNTAEASAPGTLVNSGFLVHPSTCAYMGEQGAAAAACCTPLPACKGVQHSGAATAQPLRPLGTPSWHIVPARPGTAGTMHSASTGQFGAGWSGAIGWMMGSCCMLWLCCGAPPAAKLLHGHRLSHGHGAGPPHLLACLLATCNRTGDRGAGRGRQPARAASCADSYRQSLGADVVGQHADQS
jgi:hypothetical protein